MGERQGIPTIYAGIRFRSRLEATWAAFFDQMNWSWEYEPFDLNGWIPDFALSSGRNPRPVLVEVKPIAAFDEDVAAKIDAADQEHEVLLVGIGPVKDSEYFGPGWLREVYPHEVVTDESGRFWWDSAVFGCWSGYESAAKNPGHLIGFCHAYGSYADRITGCYDGGCYGTGDSIRGQVLGMWATAKNRVQWQASDSKLYRGWADRG